MQYSDDAERDSWLGEYHNFHDNPIIMLEDGAYVKVSGRTTMLVRGAAWCWRAGHDEQQIAAREPIALH